MDSALPHLISTERCACTTKLFGQFCPVLKTEKEAQQARNDYYQGNRGKEKKQRQAVTKMAEGHDNGGWNNWRMTWNWQKLFRHQCPDQDICKLKKNRSISKT